jgi:pyruvate/2-oxoglutarate/acetoin dehydrogenase E1 component
MDALENAGRLSGAVYRECTLYTTLSPCPMCSGAILLYGIPRVIVGENRTFMGEETLLRSRGVSVEVVDLRSIRPLDIDTVLASVAKTHRVLIVEEQKPFASVGSQLAYMIQREAFDELDGPIHRVTTIDAPAIYSPPVEVEQLPNPQRVLKAALEAVAGS